MKELESLNSIFKNRIFKIPDYQRGYAWTERQLKDFWEDITHLPIERFHYTGVLSLKKVTKNVWENWNDEKWIIEERGFKPFYVVDGQQRLTTFVILIQSITELIEKLPENKNKKDSEIYLESYNLKYIREEYLMIEQPPRFIIRTHKFSYEIDNPSFQFLKYRIYNESNPGTIRETVYTLNLENAKRFFTEKLKNLYNNNEFGIKEIEILFKKLTQNLMFNVYEISDDFDVFVAFETMNNRGKKLSNLELLKNRLIYLTTLYDEDELKSDEENSLRKTINDAWKEVYDQLGRNKIKPLDDDDFLIAHWIMYFQYSREKGDDYIRFLLEKQFTTRKIFDKKKIEENGFLSPKEIENYVNSLKSAAVHWYNIHNPLDKNTNLTENERLWIDRLNRIGIIYFRPLVTASFLSNKIDSNKRVQLFQAIERFIFIAFRLTRAISTYRNSEFYKAARKLCNNELSVSDIIDILEERMNYCFNKSEEKSEIYFNHIYFKTFIDKKFKNSGNGGFYSWNGLRYFLYEYEMEKVKDHGSAKID